MFPLAAIGAGIAGAKLVGGFIKGKGQQKAAQAKEKADNEANAENDRRAQNAFNSDEDLRAARLNAANALLQGLAGGRYAIDPKLLAAITQRRAYGGAVNPRSTVSAGSGQALVGGLIGDVGDIGTDVLIGELTRGGAGGTRPTTGASTPQPVASRLQTPSMSDLRRY